MLKSYRNLHNGFGEQFLRLRLRTVLKSVQSRIFFHHDSLRY